MVYFLCWSFIFFIFLFLEGYNIHVNNSKTVLHPNKTSILTSPVAITSQARCFTVQWLTKGSNPGNLTIFLITRNETKAVWRDEEMKKTAIPNKAFNSGEILMWQTAFVDLPTKTNFKVSNLAYSNGCNGTSFFFLTKILLLIKIKIDDNITHNLIKMKCVLSNLESLEFRNFYFHRLRYYIFKTHFIWLLYYFPLRGRWHIYQDPLLLWYQ